MGGLRLHGDDERPPYVLLQVWGVPARSIPRALLNMGTHRRGLRQKPGLRFSKLLGTGHSRTFTLTDADPRHWVALTVWDTPDDAAAATTTAPLADWDDICDEQLVVGMVPLASRGSWSGERPFEPVASHHPHTAHLVAAITRARLRLRRSPVFWRAVPTAVAELHHTPGLLLSLGIGESPLAHMGTFSLWQDATALRGYAYRTPGHRKVISQTREVGWYAEELFARFSVTSVRGTLGGVAPATQRAQPTQPSDTVSTGGSRP
jgi:hypothetical protein